MKLLLPLLLFVMSFPVQSQFFYPGMMYPGMMYPGMYPGMGMGWGYGRPLLGALSGIGNLLGGVLGILG
ncbi:hypothetical protein Y032_0131g1583 [Ancylostoma ceylanicum]|uniref:Uncharacterized protein n=1 Tax=Ancylostoma ceylanicum TaxID=53326 RepID=A0A016T6S4_9BILA|nr:hypothetical protein Y032_0131g1583 [Ancylostoma ceylanicum]